MSRAHRFSREACQQLQLAVELIKLGLRRTLVQEMTRLSRNALRPLYQELHRRAPGGPLPSQPATCVQPRQRQLHGVLFALLYRRHTAAPTVDPQALACAYRLYQQLAPADAHRLDPNDAWLVARAVGVDWLRVQPCWQCGAPNLVAVIAAVARCGVCGARQRAQPAARPSPPRQNGLPAPMPSGIRGLADCQALALAATLVQIGARGVLVQLATGLSEHAVSALYRALRGRPPPAGPLPAGVESLLRRSRQHLHAALFAELYRRRLPPCATGIDYWELVFAYRLYLSLTPDERYRLTINSAWVIARDLSARLVWLRACPDCATPFLVLADATQLPHCPVCTLARHGALQSARPQKGSKRHASMTG